jgi:hypothetical protein
MKALGDSMITDKKEDNKISAPEFISRYKAAIKAKLTREQFAKILGILPDSLLRRRLAIYKETGLNLAILESKGNGFLEQDKLEAYYNFLSTIEKNDGIGKVTRNISGFQRYVVTSAQNATPISPEFFASLMTYCNVHDAQLLVIPYRYKNPTSIWIAQDQDGDWWAPPLHPYIIEDNVRLTDKLVILGGIKIQPTASEPLSGFEGHTGMDSSIVGHPKIQLKSVPTINNAYPKIITTTGAVTIQNYTDSKAGWKGAFHHSLAALVIEIEDNGNFHIRHIHADASTGEFYDLDGLYTPTGVTYGHRAAALVAGDIHAEFIDPAVEAATYTSVDSLANVVNPENYLFHDLTDYYARNHHHRGNDIIGAGKHRFGRNNVEKGLQQAADFIDRVTRPGTKNIVVKSNHDEAFDRWLREADIRGDYENAQFYYYMKYHQMKNIRMNRTGFDSIDPFEFWCHNPDTARGLKSIGETTFLKRDDSFRLNGIELAFHGDVGPNGARGSIKNLAKLSTKLVIGHSHSPGIYEGCVQVGVSSYLNLEYKRGPSSWICSHAIVYPDGKRTLIHIIDGKWRR